MKGIIIIEGSDASGKSTLAKKLAIKYNGIIFHQTYRFKNKIPIYHMTILRKALKLSKKQLVILDRLHISEYIYGKVFRKEKRWPWMLNSFNRFCKELNIPIILCIPESIKEGIKWFEETKNKRIEMFNDMTKILEEYLKYAENHKDVIIYNRNLSIEYHSWYDDYTYAVIENKLNKEN